MVGVGKGGGVRQPMTAAAEFKLGGGAALEIEAIPEEGRGRWEEVITSVLDSDPVESGIICLLGAGSVIKSRIRIRIKSGSRFGLKSGSGSGSKSGSGFGSRSGPGVQI
jgi:hypothetical protein